MRTILLTGASGQVGWELQRTLATLGRVVAPSHAEFDLARPDTLADALRAIKPDLIVNPAAYTAVDQAETEQELAYAINAEAPLALAREAARRGITLVHYSTDYVFDGTQFGAYAEYDALRPLGVYGASKQAGEELVQASGADHLIFRTSWVYGLRGKNFLLTMQRLARERDKLAVVADQFGAPTWARSIAEATAQVLALWLSPGATAADRQRLSGIYHMSCGGRVSWHGFAEAILQDMQNRGEKIPALKAISTTEYPTPAQRPANSVLSNEKLQQTFGVRMPDWQHALALCLG
ncbi:dTDP-4-dehydrorhamnose reductase [Betaproteobacteria bacterium SCN2]|nr:dTDP-4-dehydrorhamnose reductase [Betaproteobacteria bacterium SCN2]